MKKITIDPVTRIEGHAKIDIYPRRRRARSPTRISTSPRCAASKNSPKAGPFYEMPVHHRAHLRHLPGEPSAGLRQGLRRHHGRHPARDRRREAARAASTARSSCNPTRSASSTSPRRTCCWASIPTPRAATSSASSRSNPGPGPRRHRAAQIRPGDHRRARARSACIPPGSSPAASTLRSRAAVRDRILAGLPDARAHRRTHPRVLQNRARQVRGRDRELRLRAHHVRRLGGWPAACSGTTACCSSRMPKAPSWPTEIRRARLRRVHRRSRAARFLPEGALLQAAGLSRRRLPRGPAGAPECGRPLRHAAWPTPNWPSSASVAAPWSHSSFHYHYARLIEVLHGLEKIELLLADPAILDTHVRAHAGVNCAGRRRHDRSAARRADPSLQGGRTRRHQLGQPDRRHRPQQPGHQPQRRAGGPALHRRQSTSRKAC